jgi:hypothetical protein
VGDTVASGLSLGRSGSGTGTMFTVKSQTSRGLDRLRQALGETPAAVSTEPSLSTFRRLR